VAELVTCYLDDNNSQALHAVRMHGCVSHMPRANEATTSRWLAALLAYIASMVDRALSGGSTSRQVVTI
jgi:hypothetical protein